MACVLDGLVGQLNPLGCSLEAWLRDPTPDRGSRLRLTRPTSSWSTARRRRCLMPCSQTHPILCAHSDTRVHSQVGNIGAAVWRSPPLRRLAPPPPPGVFAAEKALLPRLRLLPPSSPAPPVPPRFIRHRRHRTPTAEPPPPRGTARRRHLPPFRNQPPPPPRGSEPNQPAR